MDVPFFPSWMQGQYNPWEHPPHEEPFHPVEGLKNVTLVKLEDGSLEMQMSDPFEHHEEGHEEEH